jgi:hypothetical protein
MDAVSRQLRKLAYYRSSHLGFSHKNLKFIFIAFNLQV